MDETLLYQLENDLKTMFESVNRDDITVKKSYDGDIDISYPLVIVQEVENSYDQKYYDLKEHVVNVGYQITVMAEQTALHDAEYETRTIVNLIKNYMRGERYHSLRESMSVPITRHPNDSNIKIGYLRYTGCIDIDNHIIYRRDY